MGESTGAAVIFGATGGVMEAALRTAVETLTGEELANLEFTDVRGTKGIKEADISGGRHGYSVWQLLRDLAMQENFWSR